jgi:hypothetical protein
LICDNGNDDNDVHEKKRHYHNYQRHEASVMEYMNENKVKENADDDINNNDNNKDDNDVANMILMIMNNLIYYYY